MRMIGQRDRKYSIMLQDNAKGTRGLRKRNEDDRISQPTMDISPYLGDLNVNFIMKNN